MVFVPLLVDEAECPCQKMEVSAAAVAVTLNPLRPFSQMAPVASWAAMKNLESESQAVLEALVADQARWSLQRPCRSVPADQVPPMDQAALRAT